MLVNDDLIKIEKISEIKKNISNYDIFGNTLVITTMDDKQYAMLYDETTEEEIIKRMENLLSKLDEELIDNKNELKAFYKSFILVGIFSLAPIILALSLSSLLPLIFEISSVFIGKRIINVIKDLKDESEVIQSDLTKLNSVLSCKKIDKKIWSNSRLDYTIESKYDKTCDINHDEVIETLSLEQLKQLSIAANGKQTIGNVEEEKRINFSK